MDDRASQKTTTHLTVIPDCNDACPSCCPGTAEIIEAESNARLRDKALNVSGYLMALMMTAHIAFCYVGKTLPFPEILWAIILAPWFGAGGAKLVDLIKERH